MNLPKLLRQAEKLVSYGKLNEAIEVYQEILSEDFQNIVVHNLISDLYIEKRDMQRASRHLFKISSDCALQGNFVEATSGYKKIIKILPKNILAREKLLEIFTRNNAKNDVVNLMVELAAISEGEGNLQKAIEYLEKLNALDPSNKSYPTKLAFFLNERGFKDRSIEILYQLTHDYFREDRYEEALGTLEKIRAINPKDKRLPTRMAEVCEKQGKMEKGIELLLNSLAEDPAQPDTMSYLAKLCIKVGKVDEAERIYEKLIKINKSFLAQTVPFVEVLLAERKIDRALAYIERLQKETSDGQTRQKCVELLEEILKHDPQKLEAYRLLEICYGASFQYDQLAITFQSHADAYLAKCEYAKALELARQLVDLEPYNEEYRKKHQTIEKLVSGGKKAPSKATLVVANDEDDDGHYVPAKVDAHFDKTISIVTDEDVESFIVDIELLEKFGQHVSAIGRLEHVLKQYPHEIRFRQKLKSLYFDRKMPKRAAQECLEIAKLLQQQNQKEEASKYLREAQRLNPILSSAKRDAPTTTVRSAPPAAASETKGSYGALRGDLSEIGLLDVIQLLENCQKSGKLMVSSEGKAGVILFNSGRMVNATYQEKSGEQAVYALVAVKGGTFDYQPASTPFDVVIHNSNTNLLLEGLRLLDEANRDLNESEALAQDDPETSQTESDEALISQVEPAAMSSAAPSQFINDDNPLEEL